MEDGIENKEKLRVKVFSVDEESYNNLKDYELIIFELKDSRKALMYEIK